MAKKAGENSGFTLLELIVVLAGLGILSGLAIPNYMKYLDYAKVDEAKSLLNSIAADCLQGLRRTSGQNLSEPINKNVLSYSRLRNTGYVFKDGTSRSIDEDFLPNCRSVFITAAVEDDRLERFPDLGFTLSNTGILTKIAVNSGSETKYPAESWAGKNTTNETDLIEWNKLNESIETAKKSCLNNFNSFIKASGTGRTKEWDPLKTSKCTDKPPKFEDPETCTSAACTKDVWYIDGEICGYSDEAFRQCQRDKISAACQKEKDKKASENHNTETIEGDLLPNCDEPVWFIEGEDVGSAESWKRLMCEKNKNDFKMTYTNNGEPIEYCGPSPIYICGGEEFLGSDAKAFYDTCRANNKDSICRGLLDEDALKKESGGPYTSPTPTDMTDPVGKDCNTKYWYCKKSGKLYKGGMAKENYENDEACQCGELYNPVYCDIGVTEYCC